MFGLTKRQIQFAYAVAENPEWSATKCAIHAGYSEPSARTSASENMQNQNILKAIEDRKEQLAVASGISRELVLREWLAVAMADPNELVRVVVKRCRDCWLMADSALPVNPECKACDGQGQRSIMLKDSASLNGPARRLFAGAKQTKDGIEVKLRDQDAAWRNIADYLGMLNKSKGELAGPGGGPIPVLHGTPADLSDAQLEAICAASLLASGDNLGVSAGVSPAAMLPSTIIEGSYEPVSVP